MAKKGRTTNHSSMEKEDSHEFNNNEEYLYNYYYFSPEVYTDENNCLIPSKASGAYSEFKSFIKNNKIPEYARDYKKEYLCIRGLNKEFEYFTKKLNDLNNGLFETNSTNRIKNFMKRFLRGQENGKFKDISNFIFPDNILNNIIFINQQFGYYKLRYDAFCDNSDDDSDSDSDSDSDNVCGVREYLVDGKPYPGFIEFYDIFKQIFNQIKIDDDDDIDDDYCKEYENIEFVLPDSDIDSDYEF